MKLKAPAKINFGLWIGARRDDGYHPVSTIYIPVSFFDFVVLEPTGDGRIRLECDDPAVPADERNLCWKAAAAFFASARQHGGVRITLEKHIPAAAGLGGGSSDAAAVLRGLSRISGGAVSPAHLHDIAVHIGADVSFFLKCKPCAAGGIGEILTPVVFPWKPTILLVIPPFSVSTAEAFRLFDEKRTPLSEPVDYRMVLQALDSLESARETVRNDFEPVLFPQYPDLLPIKHRLYDCSAVYASLTGSGSAVYGMFESEDDARNAAGYFSEKFRTEVVSPCTTDNGKI